MDDVKIVRVVVLNSETEAAIMEDILNQEGISFSVRTFHDASYDGIFQNQNGWGCIEAPEEYSDRIKSIYLEAVKGKETDAEITDDIFHSDNKIPKAEPVKKKK